MSERLPGRPSFPELRESFRKLEEWLAEHCPSAYEDLNPGAKESHLEVVESELGVPFPPQLAAFFHEHDGQSGDGPPIFAPFELLDLESARREWRALKAHASAPPGIFPVASDGRGALVACALNTNASHMVLAWSPDVGLTACSSDLASWMNEQLAAREHARIARPAQGAVTSPSPRWDCRADSVPPA